MATEPRPPEDRAPVGAARPGRTGRHRFTCAMRWGDMDAQGHINNALYLDYLQEARVHFLLTGPPALQSLLSTGVLVVSHQIEYLAPVEFGDHDLIIDLWVDSVGGSRFVVGYDVLDGDVLAARARTAAVPFDLATQSLRRLNVEERTHLTALAERAPLMAPLPRPRMSGEPHRYPLSVRWSDLDSYGHVNNVRYFDYVQEARIALIVEALGWTEQDVWLIVRQDIDHLRPLDFRLEPYEVATVVTKIGNRSFRLAVEIRDPVDGTSYASARTVVVGAAPLTEARRAALSRWSVAPGRADHGRP